MLSKEDNELITQTDRGTPMGELFRRFWIPALLCEELPGPDGNPVRVKILGEELVAYRDSDGRVGLIDAYCPHRGAPMFFARNEDCGIRCLYHGWKFDTTGQCTEMPNIPHGQTAKDRMRTIAYPTIEAANMVWTYMGPPDRQPPFPEFPYCVEVPKENVYVTRYEIACNWLQGQEGDYDPGHAVLHSTLGQNRDVAAEVFQTTRINGVPFIRSLAVEDTPIGVLMSSTWDTSGPRMAVNSSHMVLPCFPNAGLSAPGVFNANIRIPIDDSHENHYRLRWTRRGFTEKELYDYKYGGFIFPHHEPGTYRADRRIDNDYGHDPVLQRQFNFSGVTTFPTQDLMMIENQWGPIADRTREHLVASDRDIIAVRRRLLKMAKALANGIEPEEPFRLTGIRQEQPEVVMVPTANTIGTEVVDQVLESMNTSRIQKVGSETESMWGPQERDSEAASRNP